MTLFLLIFPWTDGDNVTRIVIKRRLIYCPEISTLTPGRSPETVALRRSQATEVRRCNPHLTVAPRGKTPPPSQMPSRLSAASVIAMAKPWDGEMADRRSSFSKRPLAAATPVLVTGMLQKECPFFCLAVFGSCESIGRGRSLVKTGWFDKRQAWLFLSF